MTDTGQPAPSVEAVQGTETVTRRSFLSRAALVGSAAVVATTVAQEANAGLLQASGVNSPGRSVPASSFLELLRPPDAVAIYRSFTATEKAIPLSRAGMHWTANGVTVETEIEPNALRLALTAPSTPIVAVHVRWLLDVFTPLRALGDAWERSYGELGWRDLIPERVMPWYFATWDGAACHGYGIKTNAAALCFWQLDPEGVSLWLNVANGGDGVMLGQRALPMATVITRRGEKDEPAVEAVSGLCRLMCARPSRLIRPIYGANDWNYAYGKSTAQSILEDTRFIVGLSPSGSVRPFSVIDDGYLDGTPAWPSMTRLAEDIRQTTARPGIWIRPLKAPRDAAEQLLLPGVRFGEKKERAREFAFDPTHPEAQEKIRAKVTQVTGWGYELVKHDFSTYELLGKWGFEMGPQPSFPGWSLHDRTRTNAEVLVALYTLLREAAGETVLLEGCNTIGQLGQGIFDLQRTGDDTSGREWERTRRMGVNTLGFRLPQQAVYFTLDADLVGITDAIPWEFNRQWLDVLARSGAVTMISPGPPSRGPEQKNAIREAFKIAAMGGESSRPIDWMDSSTPEHWQTAGKPGSAQRYRWSGSQGASPFMNG